MTARVHFLVAAAAAFVAMCAPSLARAGGHAGGNGGAGVVIDGTNLIATIGSLPVIKIKPLEAREIPGLTELQGEIAKLAVPSRIRNEFLIATLPTVERRYYRVDDGAVSPDEIAKIKTAYQTVLQEDGIPESEREVRVVALTDGKKTLLLPDFFENMVDGVAQSSVLFHEGVWVRFPPAGHDPTLEEYRRVIHMDEAFERWWRRTDRVTIYTLLGRVYQDNDLVIESYFREDLEQHLFSDVLDSKQTVPVSFFLGDSVTRGALVSRSEDLVSVEDDRVLAGLIDEAGRYLNSYALQFLLKNARFQLTFSSTAPGGKLSDKARDKLGAEARAECIEAVTSLGWRVPLMPGADAQTRHLGWKATVPIQTGSCSATLTLLKGDETIPASSYSSRAYLLVDLSK